MKRLSLSSGLTLVEVLIAVFILSIAIVSILLLYSNAITSTDFAWDITVATSIGETILEEMQSRHTFMELTNYNWDEWLHQEELNVLPQQNVEIEFMNTFNNPIDVKVTVQWEKRLRKNHVVLITKIAK